MNLANQKTGYLQVSGVWRLAWIGWIPLVVLSAGALFFGFDLAAWAFMWMLALALYLGCKWLTWWQNKNTPATVARQLAYLFAWPGMDAEAFLNSRRNTARPSGSDWTITILKIISGAVLLWGVARLIPATESLARGWVGLTGLILLLHFGTFHLLALVWQTAGVNAQPLMCAPSRAVSLAEFWGLRWNSAFNRLVHDLLFRPLYRLVGAVAATMIVFLVSGLIHELVISVPARGGYGLPTMYFLIQGAGLIFERSPLGKKLGLRRGVAGWLFTMTVTAGPAFWLFHPAFITRVILPFLHVLNAT